MDVVPLTMTQRLAQIASTMQTQRTGHAPRSVSVVLGEDTLVVTLRDALTPAEKALVKSAEGAARVQEFHRQLFANSSVEQLRNLLPNVVLRNQIGMFACTLVNDSDYLFDGAVKLFFDFFCTLDCVIVHFLLDVLY